MHPVLFSDGPWDVGTHAVFVGLGVLVAGVYVVHESRRRGMWGEEMFVAVAGGLVGGALGMRASGLLRAVTSDDVLPLSDVWQHGAKSVLGGLTGAYLGVLVGKRLVGMRIRTGDVFAPAVALAWRWAASAACSLSHRAGRRPCPGDLSWTPSRRRRSPPARAARPADPALEWRGGQFGVDRSTPEAA